MSIISSLLFGTTSNSNFFGIEVSFREESSVTSFFHANCFTETLTVALTNKFLTCITSGYFHVFVHEVGHSLANGIFTGKLAPIVVYNNPCSGTCQFLATPNYGWKTTVVALAGPALAIAFEIGKIFIAVALSKLCRPVSLLLMAGSVLWIAGEWLYAVTSACTNDNGDFHQIKREGTLDLSLSLILLTSECAFGIFAATLLF